MFPGWNARTMAAGRELSEDNLMNLETLLILMVLPPLVGAALNGILGRRFSQATVSLIGCTLRYGRFCGDSSPLGFSRRHHVQHTLKGILVRPASPRGPVNQ